jgi:heat shock protein HslJ
MKNILLLSIIIFSVFSLHAVKQKKDAGKLTLLNTKWALEVIYNSRVIPNQDTAFIIFYENYQMSGNLGCNIFFGNFNYGKKMLKLDFEGSTKKLCSNMFTEKEFVKMLRDEVSSYYIEKDQLFIRNKNKVVAVFKGVQASK